MANEDNSIWQANHSGRNFIKLLLTVTNGYDILCLTINVKLFIIIIKRGC